MPEWLNEALDVAKPYWPFAVKCMVFWFVGNNLKKRLFTKARAARGGLWGFARGSMWAHPMLAGVAWGALWPYMPAIDWVTTRGGAITEGIAAGVFSTVGFMLLERVAEARGWTPVLRVLHEVGRDSMVPSEPPPPGG